jgi:hypothetical protein
MPLRVTKGPLRCIFLGFLHSSEVGFKLYGSSMIMYFALLREGGCYSDFPSSSMTKIKILLWRSNFMSFSNGDEASALSVLLFLSTLSPLALPPLSRIWTSPTQCRLSSFSSQSLCSLQLKSSHCGGCGLCLRQMATMSISHTKCLWFRHNHVWNVLLLNRPQTEQPRSPV